MDNDSYGNRDKMGYADLVFLQINRIEALSTSQTLSSNQATQLYCSCSFLHPLIHCKLSNEDKQKLDEEFTKLPQKDITYLNAARDYFYLLMKYLPKTNLIPGKRITYDTGGGEK